MSSLLPLTQIIPVTPDVAALNYRLLEGEWPILDKAPPLLPKTMDRIKNEGNGYSITSNLGYLSLGFFYIGTNLLEAHPTQRPISQAHVTKLLEEFKKLGVLRSECPGVVIGLGEGWLDMKYRDPPAYMITPSFFHLDRLSLFPGGPIGQIIRGGHRTAAIKRFSNSTDLNLSSQNFWFYNVLIPGMSYLTFILGLFVYGIYNIQPPTNYHTLSFLTFPA